MELKSKRIKFLLNRNGSAETLDTVSEALREKKEEGQDIYAFFNSNFVCPHCGTALKLVFKNNNNEETLGLRHKATVSCLNKTKIPAGDSTKTKMIQKEFLDHFRSELGFSPWERKRNLTSKEKEEVALAVQGLLLNNCFGSKLLLAKKMATRSLLTRIFKAMIVFYFPFPKCPCYLEGKELIDLLFYTLEELF